MEDSNTMATIYRPKRNGKFHGSFWYAKYKLADGKFKYRSTGLTEKRKAQRLANDWEQEHLKVREEETDRHAEAFEEYKATCAKFLRGANSNGDIGDLFRESNDRLTLILTGEEDVSTTLKGFLVEWLSNRQLHIAERTYESYKLNIRCLIKAMGDLGDKRLCALKTVDLERIQRSLLHTAREKKTKMRTLNYKMGILKSAVTDAYNKGLIHRNIGLAVKDLPEDDSTLKAPFTKEEIEKLIKAASEGWKGAILFGSQTGLRIKNLAELQWADINLADREMTIIPCKQRRAKKKSRSFCLTDQMYNYLNFIGPKNEGFVFPEVAAMHETSRPKKFAKIMRDAGVPKEVTLPDRQIGVRTFHSLRHSFNTFMAQSGVSQEVRMQITGHASEAVNDMYTHFDTEMIRNAVQQGIPEIKWQNAP